MNLLTASITRFFRFAPTAILCLVGLFASSAFAQTPAAGTSIGNQVAVTYTDASAITRTATSNIVTTLVLQVPAFTLTATQSKNSAINAPVSFPHTLTNTGNGPDTFNVAVANQAADNFDLTGKQVRLDANCDGVGDGLPITQVGPVPAGSMVCLVVEASVPESPTAGQTGILQLTATSQFSLVPGPAVTITNNDTTVISPNAVISVFNKSISANSDATPGPYTYTLTFTNTGSVAATAVTITDVIPAGFTYVTGSGRWSSSAVALTDAAGGDPAGIAYDYNVTTAGAITATIANLAANATQTISFNVALAAGATGTILNTAQLCYNNGATVVPATCPATGAPSNTVPFTINKVAATSAVSANGSGTNSVNGTAEPVVVASAPQGGTVVFNNYVWNLGTSADSFDMTTSASSFPAGTTFQFFKSDGVTPLVDTNGNGVPDTGDIPRSNDATCTAANGYVADTVAGRCGYRVVVRAVLPASASGGPARSVTVTATSRIPGGASDTVIDTLTAIAASNVDLRAADNAAGTGSGTAMPSPLITTQTVSAGASTTFTLKVNNLGTVADTYDLSASTDGTFGTTVLPAGWTVAFRLDGGAGTCATLGAAISNTGIVNIAPAAATTICATVSVPAGAAASSATGTDIYFRVLSPSTLAVDVIHDAVVVATTRSISLVTNNSGQIFPGGSVVYTHTIRNAGNVTEGATAGQITLALAMSGAVTGWGSSLYWDANDNGTLDPTDPLITDLSALTPAGLAPGASARLFVRVTAPSSAAVGDANSTSVTATITGAINGVVAPPPVVATDISAVIAGQIRVEKMQAVDNDCNGVADSAFSTGVINVAPNRCILYQTTITNQGTTVVNNVVASDATPSSTTFAIAVTGTPALAPAAITATPAVGGRGTVQITLPTLAAGASQTFTFGVRVNP